MKTIQFKLDITFSDDVEPQDLQTIMNNVASAISSEANNGMGIAPDGAEYYTKACSVSHILVNKPAEVIIAP